MTNHIPTRQRLLVKSREHNRCLRCGCPALRGEWHHRRSRSVHGPHRHCTCNGVWLCHTCHTWAHAHPLEAVAAGLIVTRYSDRPGEVPVTSHYGTLLLTCDGLVTFKKEEQP